MHGRRSGLLLLAVMLMPAWTFTASAAEPLYAATYSAGQKPGWGDGTVVTSDDRSVLRLERSSKGTASAHDRAEGLAALAGKPVTVALTARVTGLKDADPPRHTAKVLLTFEDGNRKALGYDQLVPEANGQWHTTTKTVTLPAGVQSIKLSPGVFSAAGTFEVDSITIAAGEQPADPPAEVVPVAVPDTDFFDVTKAPYNADATGRTDSTEAIQLAFTHARHRFEREEEASKGDRRVMTVFFPAGTYLVSDTLSFGDGIPEHLHIVGEGPEKSIIRLVENAPGFAGKDTRAVIDFIAQSGWRFKSNVSFNNAVRDLAIEVGAGNPSAAGLAYHNNNTGYIRNVTIRSLDPEGRGHTGLWVPGSLSGIAYIQGLTVEGFDQAAYFRDRKIMYVLEDVTITGQREAGIVSEDKPLTIRRLTSDNAVPAIVNKGDQGQIVLLDSELTGGSGDTAAIVNKGQLFARNITVSGYGSAIDDHGQSVPGGRIDEYVHGEVLTLGEGAPKRSLDLPIKDTPEIQIEPKENWVVVRGDAQEDDTDAIQAAIDSGATTVHLPDRYLVSRPIVVRGAVRHFKGSMPGGIGSSSSGIVATKAFRKDQPVLRIETGDHEATLIEDLAIGQEGIEHPYWAIEHASEKTVVFRNAAAGPYRNSGRGDVFFESAVGGWGTSAFEMMPHPFIVITDQNAWFRHYNPEGSFPHLVNDGGAVVVLGSKLGEWHGPYIETLNGGRTEVLGAMFNSIATTPMPNRAWLINDRSSVSVVAVDDQRVDRNPHPLAVRQFGAQGEQVLTYEQASERGKERRALSLFRGEAGPAPAAAAPYAWIENAEPWVAAPGATTLPVVARLSEPLQQDVMVPVAVASPSSVNRADVAAVSPIRIPAGRTEGRGELQVSARERNQQITLRPLAGEAHRADPLRPHPTFYVPGSAVEVDRGLALHLPAKTPLRDVSGKDRGVKPENVNVRTVDGRSAIVFDGPDSRVILGAGGGGYGGFMQSPFEQRSVALWVHADSTGNAFREGGGFGGLFITVRDGKLRYTVAAGNARERTVEADWPGTGWHHVAAVFDHGVQRLYLDGRPVGAAPPISFEIPRHSATGGLGQFGFTGAIGETRIYDRALTPDEVATLAKMPER